MPKTLRIRTPQRTYRSTHEGSLNDVLVHLGIADHVDAVFDNQAFNGIGIKPNRNAAEWEDGKMLYCKMKPEPASADSVAMSTPTPAATKAIPETQPKIETYENTPLDRALKAKDGLIPRKRDAKFCKHGEKAMCEYCMPLEPYDAKYHSENKIKHLSYYAYRKKTSSQETPRYRFRPVIPCIGGGHPPYPKAMCAKCQPSSCTLQGQEYRHIDHVEFACSKLLDTFIDLWRSTGHQHIGVMFGRFAEFPSVPLGIKARVSHIHIPIHHAFIDGVKLDPFPPVVPDLSMFGLQPVGYIFTDLEPDGQGVLNKRWEKSYTLTNLELLLGASMQMKIPRWSTVVVTGDEKGQITPDAYMVSDAVVDMHRDDVLLPALDPRVLLVKKAQEKEYIPEIFWKSGNGRKSVEDRGFPVEYGIVNLTHGFPTVEEANQIDFASMHAANPPTLAVLHEHLTSPLHLHEQIYHPNVVAFIESTGVLAPDELSIMHQAIEAHRDGLTEEAKKITGKLMHSAGWSTLRTVAYEESVHGHADSTSWKCRHCTYVNSETLECEMCGLPKD